MKPGEYFLDEASGPVGANVGRRTHRLTVRNTGDRPIQVGSHYHFSEANRALEFDRSAAYGMRLNIPSGTAVRFEPGEEKDIELTDLGGRRVVHGLNGAVGGSLDALGAKEKATNLYRREGFRSPGETKNR